jgi:aryl-alcohol dehydrogenase-like predicted oxidoreductase
MLLHALDRGVPWVDTAEVYGAGRSERLLGDVLARWPKEKTLPFLSTKLSWEHLSAAQVRPSLAGSLRRMGVPRVDLYLVHAPNARVPIAETMGALEQLWKEGLIGAIGVSNFSVEEMEAAQAALREARVAVNQVQFNLLEREDADPILDYCQKQGIVVEAYSPTARGLLAGRFLTGRGPPRGDVRSERGIFAPERLAATRARVAALLALAEEAEVPLLSLALHGVARHGAAPVFGASLPDQLDELLAAWEVRPSEAVLDRAERLARGDGD